MEPLRKIGYEKPKVEIVSYEEEIVRTSGVNWTQQWGDVPNDNGDFGGASRWGN